MQCERGLIDKAIDCNSQAMKFCKDKDPECLRRLQAQNADLVARKLKQSIARIERGKFVSLELFSRQSKFIIFAHNNFCF